ncbi:MAG: serine protease [Rhizobacter sp.]|nr:serine protease [Rhizobacter sp.]
MKKRAALSVLLAAAVGACSSAAPLLWPDFTQAIQRHAPAVVGVGDAHGVLGSGFRIQDTRFVATAAHVVRSLQGPPIIRWASRPWPARVVRIDDDADIALLEVDSDAPMPGLALSTRPVLAGQWVIVLGCPFGAAPTATTGIVSALPGAVLEPAALARRMQLNAAVNPGNSGGPVLGFDGQVIGLANATIPGGYGLGFAVPVAALAALLSQQPSRP